MRRIAQAAPTAELARELGCDRKHLLELRHRLRDNARLRLDRNPLDDDVVEVDGLIANDKFCLIATAHLPPRRSNIR